MGSFISDFAEPIISQIRQYTAPLDPVIDFLTSPTPDLEDFGIEATPLELAKIFGIAEAEYVEVAADIITLINSVPIIDGNVYVPLGSFDLGTVDARAEEDLHGVIPTSPETVDPEDRTGHDLPGRRQLRRSVQDDDGVDISFPMLEQPTKVFQLFLGNGDVDLFLVDLPELVVSFPFPMIKIGPLWPPIPIFISLGGGH